VISAGGRGEAGVGLSRLIVVMDHEVGVEAAELARCGTRIRRLGSAV
jgi:hypothetical protein